MVYNTKLLEKGIRAQFERSMQEMIQRPYLSAVRRLYTEAPSNASQETYAWLGDIPGVREWIGDKSLGGLEDYSYTIKNKDWYDGFSIDRNELEDEQIAAIGPRVQALAMSVAQWPADLVVQLIKNGETNLAYDGSSFFANRSTNDNMVSGSGSSASNIATDITTARSRMMKFVSDTGRVMGLVPNVMAVPPELERAALEAVRSATISTNVNSDGIGYNPVSDFGIQVIPMPQLEDANDWYMFATDFPLRPFIFQNRRGVDTVLDDTEVARNRKLHYSAEMRGNAGYGFYQMAIKVTNS